MNKVPMQQQQNIQPYSSQSRNEGIMSTPQSQQIKNQQSQMNSPFTQQFQMICDQHQDEFYTNFCIQTGCNLPLCPECLDEHTNYHKDNNTHSDIKAFKNVRAKCSQKLKEGTMVINRQLELIEQNQAQKTAFNNQTKEIEIIKNQIIMKINAKIQNLVERLDGKHFDETHAGIHQLREKVYAFQQELQKIHSNLDGHKSVESIKKIFDLDLNKIISDFNIAYSQQSDQIAQMEVTVNDDRFQNIESEIDKFIYLQKGPGMKRKESQR